MEINISNLQKKYGSNTALQDINLTIGKGMFGLLGPNGAGKTTLMRILATLLDKSAGDITINGIDIANRKAIRNIIGYLPQEFSFYPKMTVYEVMDYLSILAGIRSAGYRRQNIISLLEQVNLQKFLRTKVRSLSGGMKQRLGIAQALINKPQLLIVDEPTAGLDPEERVRFRNLLVDFAKDRIVILSTHIAGDIEFTCSRLAILKQGLIAYEGKISDLLKQAANSIWTLVIDRNDLAALREKATILTSVSEGSKISLKLLADQQPFPRATPAQPTIEDAYMKIMKGIP